MDKISWKGILGIVFVVVVLALFVVGVYQGLTKPTADEAIASLFEADQDNVNAIKASLNGDSYCKSCHKYMAGKRRICTYCGQYL